MKARSPSRYALEVVDAGLAKIFAPPEKLLPSEWAEKHRQLSSEANARGGGKWHNLPMQVEPLDCAINPEIGTVVLMWASQTAGKTELLLNLCGFFSQHDPSSIMMVQPDLAMAEAWATERLEPMIRDTPILRDFFGVSGMEEDTISEELAETTKKRRRKRKRRNRALKKSFPGGYIVINGANSPAALASRPIRVKLFDETDRYPKSAGKEGDPAALAEVRSDTFSDDVTYKTSTPLVKGSSQIEAEFDLSDKCYWFCPCPYCKHEQSLKWKQVKWESEDKMSEAYYECENEKCKKHWSDEDRITAILRGHWKATAPFNGTRGYHLNGIYSLFPHKRRFKNRLHQMVANFIRAKRKGKKTLQVWTNTFLAETWKDEDEVRPEWHKLFERREPYTGQKIPLGVRILTAGIDCQEDRIEIEVVGWGVGEESWGIKHEVLWGKTNQPEIYTRLDQFMQTIFTRADGAQLQVNAAGFDTGYSGAQRQMYGYLRTRLGRRFYPFKGSNQKFAEPIGTSSKSKADKIKLIMVGTNRLKSYIYQRATIEGVKGEDGLIQGCPGFMHFPEEYTMLWFKGLLCEEYTKEYHAGSLHWVFQLPSVIPEGGTNRNEPLDMRVYAHAALLARGIPNWDFVERQNILTIPKEEPEPAKDLTTVRRTKRRKVSRMVAGILGGGL